MGRTSYASSQRLFIPHTADVFVAVTAENAAGLTKVEYAGPVTVDLTPPHLCCIKV